MDTSLKSHDMFKPSDILSLYFMDATPGTILSSEEIAANVLVDYDHCKRVVVINIEGLASFIAFNKPGFVITQDHDRLTDTLYISIPSGKGVYLDSPHVWKDTTDPRIHVQTVSDGVVFRILQASISVCPGLSNEETSENLKVLDELSKCVQFM
jgi:uncharacterized protein YuzE